MVLMELIYDISLFSGVTLRRLIVADVSGLPIGLIFKDQKVPDPWMYV